MSFFINFDLFISLSLSLSLALTVVLSAIDVASAAAAVAIGIFVSATLFTSNHGFCQSFVKFLEHIAQKNFCGVIILRGKTFIFATRIGRTFYLKPLIFHSVIGHKSNFVHTIDL